MHLKNHKITIIGMGYVGLPLAVEFGKIRDVIGFDINEKRIDELKRGIDTTLEVTREDLVAARYLKFSSNLSSLVSRDPRVYIVTVPTPVHKNNRPNLDALLEASRAVGRVLKSGDIVIYESTVYPGVTEEVCVPILERESGLNYLSDTRYQNFDSAEKILLTETVKPTPEGFFCGYSPERINPGDKHHRLRDVKKVTSGSTRVAAEAIDELYKEIITAGTHKASSIKVAEAAKVIENAQRDLNIAFVNELSIIFNLMEIDTAEVLESASTKWNFLPFKPGLVGGHCIGVDPYYLTYKAEELGYQSRVILAGRYINDGMGCYVARRFIQLLLKNRTTLTGLKVGVLGVTFKENCPDVRNSKVFDIMNSLQESGLQIFVMDPWANAGEVEEKYGYRITEITPENRVDSLIVAVAHKEFVNLSPSELRSLCFSNTIPVIADLKALYDRHDLKSQGFDIFRL